MRYLNECEKAGVAEGLCDLLGWGQIGKGGHSRFPVTELEIRLGILDLRDSRRVVGLPLAYCPQKSSPGVSRCCLLELGSGTKDLWDPSEMEAGGREVCQGSAVELEMRMENWVLENRREEIMSIGI